MRNPVTMTSVSLDDTPSGAAEPSAIQSVKAANQTGASAQLDAAHGLPPYAEAPTRRPTLSAPAQPPPPLPSPSQSLPPQAPPLPPSPSQFSSHPLSPPSEPASPTSHGARNQPNDLEAFVAKAPDVPQSLLRLLDFLTLVGTAVAAEDVFRPTHAGGVTRAALFQEDAWGKAEQRRSENSSQAGAEMHRRDDKAPPVASTPSVAVGATSTASSATPVDFGALLADEPGSFDPTLQVVAAKYLIGVFILDSLAMAVGKVALLEVVLLADALGYSVVATALALASLEAAIEFGASAIVPLLYRWAFGTWALSARGLMQFAVGAYTVSAGVACVVYPLLGIVTQGAGVQTEASLLVFALCHAFQYPFLNQLGDQAVEMARPHWLDTFNGLVLVTPGWPTNLDACYEKPASNAWRSIWHNNLLSRVNSDSLGYFLGLSRFVLSAIFGVVYVMASSMGDAPRWGALVAFCVLSFTCAAYMAWGFRSVQKGIRHVVLEQNHAPTPWVWDMTGGELGLTFYATIAFSVPSDAASAIVVLVVTMTTSAVNLAMIFFGGLAVVIYLRQKIRAVHEDTKGSGWMVATPTASTSTSAISACLAQVSACLAAMHQGLSAARDSIAATCGCSPVRPNNVFGQWLVQWLLLMAILLLSALVLVSSAGAQGLGLGLENNDDDVQADDGSSSPTGLLLFAGLLLIPYFAIDADLEARFQSVLFHYSEGQASGIIYHLNLFTVVLKLPVLVTNWLVLRASGLGSAGVPGTGTSSDSSASDAADDPAKLEAQEDQFEQNVGGLVLLVSVGILLASFLYYATVDQAQMCGKERSTAALVNDTGLKMVAAAEKAATERGDDPTQLHRSSSKNGSKMRSESQLQARMSLHKDSVGNDGLVGSDSMHEL